MRHLLQSLIISFAVIAIASPSFAGNDREDKNWDRDKKEQNHHSKKEKHRAGGLPRCEAELAECTINLTETEMLLQVCEDALAQCQTTAGQAFPATGQTTCWDSSGTEIPCAGTGLDGDIQAGADLSYTDTGLTIVDNNTKLEWMKQDDNQGGGTLFFCEGLPEVLDKDCKFNWDTAFTVVATLNANAYAGHMDWRLPNVRELQSIADYEDILSVHDAFNTGCVPGCTVETCSCTDLVSTGLWSSTTRANLPDFAWISIGGDISIDGKTNVKGLRAVRGGL